MVNVFNFSLGYLQKLVEQDKFCTYASLAANAELYIYRTGQRRNSLTRSKREPFICQNIQNYISRMYEEDVTAIR